MNLQLLIELDGAGHRRGVFVIGATNRYTFFTIYVIEIVISLHITPYSKSVSQFCRPEVMDRALLRPGRFGKLLYVPLPDLDERVLILKALARTKAIDADVDLSVIARMKGCENLSGADLAALVGLYFLWMLPLSLFIPYVLLSLISLYVCMHACLIIVGTNYVVRIIGKRVNLEILIVLAIQINEAAMAAVEEKDTTIKSIHFEMALSKVSPSVSDRVRLMPLFS